MKESDREAFRKYFLSGFLEEKIQRTKKYVEKIISIENEKIYVAFSGGKDSLVMMDIVVQVAPFIPIVHITYGDWYMPTILEEEINSIYYAVKEKRNHQGKYIVLRGRNEVKFWKELAGKHIPRLKEMGLEAVMLGFRKEESSARKRKVKYEREKFSQRVYFPIADWTAIDIWAYIVGENLKYLSHYDRYARYQDITTIRLSTLFDLPLSKRTDQVVYPWLWNIDKI